MAKLILRESCFKGVDNAVVKETSNGNVKCLKLNNYNQNKIDSVISMQMAFGGYLSSNYVYTMN